jgi:hypothetical protein
MSDDLAIAKIKLMAAISTALHAAEADGLDPFGEIDDVLALARHGLDDLDEALRRARLELSRTDP